MPGEIEQLSELDRRILRLLAKGWHTLEHAKSDGILTSEEIAQRLAAHPEEVLARLTFLETMGYVLNEENFGGDPTMTHRGISQHATEIHDLDRRYHVSEHGMRMTLADAIASDTSSERHVP